MTCTEVYNDIISYDPINKAKIYKKMIKKHEKSQVDFIMYDTFGYIHAKLGAHEKRRDQNTFRKKLIKRYENCIITDTDEQICEACHIIPFTECDEVDKYNVDNGLLLRSDLHKLFDSKELKINPDTMILEFSEKILNNAKMQKYKKYHGKKINVNENSIAYLRKIY